MKLYTALLSFLWLSLIWLCGCGGGASSPPPPPSLDFSISVSPSSTSVQQGATTGPITVSVSGLNGFAGSVSVAIVGLPQGVTSNPASPFSVAAGSSQQVTFSVPVSVAAGNSTITFHGTSGTLSHTATATLGVTSFSLTVTPNTSQANPLGVKIATSGATVTVSLNAINGFNGTVNFSVSSVPTGVSITPATWSLQTGQTQNLTLTASAAAFSGPAQMAISGASGALSQSASAFLRIDPFLSGTIDSTGGTLKVTDPTDPLFGLELDIPQGALSQATQIEMNPLLDLQNIQGNAIQAVIGLGVDLKPDGLLLSVPAGLRLPYPDSDHDGIVDNTTALADFLNVRVFDPGVNSWFYLPSSVRQYDRVVETQILTFSLYRWWSKVFANNSEVKYYIENSPTRLSSPIATLPDSLARAIYAWAPHMRLAGITFSQGTSDSADVAFRWESFSNLKIGKALLTCAITGAASGSFDLCAAVEAVTSTYPLTVRTFFNDDLWWTTDNAGTVANWNVQAVATHEFGHVLGLGEFSWPSACSTVCVTSFQPPVMAPYGTPVRKFFKPFAADLTALYNLYRMSRPTEMAYVTNQGSDSVSVVRLSDNTRVADIPLGSGSANGPQGITVDDERRKVYVAVYDAGKAYTIDLNNNPPRVWPFLPPTQTGAGSDEIDLMTDGSRAFVTNFLSNTVSAIQISDPRNAVAPFPISVTSPNGVAVSPDGREILITSLNGDLAIVDLVSGSESSLSVGQKLEAVSIEPNGRYVFAADAGSGLLSVINICPQRDLTTGACQGAPVLVTPSIPVGQNPLAISLLVDSSRSLHTAYVSNFSDGSMTVIDLASCLELIQSNCQRQTITGFTNPVGMALTPDGRLLYVADFGANEVRIVDTSTNQLLDQPRIAVGTNPVGIAITSHPIPAFFDFALDSLSVQGNISPSFADGFDDGSLVATPTSRLVFEQGITGADESDGYLRFRSNDGARVREDFLVDSATVTPALNKGAGDSTSLAVFRPDIPALGQFYCLGIEGSPSGTESTQMCVAPASSGPIIELGSPVNVVESHPLPISGTSPVVLRLKLLDSQKQLVASFSTDGGQTFTDFQTVRTIFAQDTAFFVYVQASAKLPFISPQQMTSSRTSELRVRDTAEHFPTARMPSPPDVSWPAEGLAKESAKQ
ncbi:MAG: matrixin family metalloprotease [Acidobacteriia bacterium]|nr:matrixin family metalloprotease [Terriglobia bacterium]